MNELSTRARDLIAKVDDGDGPTEAERARLRASVLARVGAGVAVAGAVVATSTAVEATSVGTASAVGASVVKSSMIALAVKGLAVLAIVGVGVVAYVKTTSSAPSAPSRVPPVVVSTASPKSTIPTRAPSPAQMNVSPPVSPSTEARSVAPRVEPTKVPAPAAIVRPGEPSLTALSPSSSPVPESFDAETRDLAVALAALSEGHPLEALSDLDEQDSRYPRGALGEEREASRVDALCALGRVPEARAAAVRFLREHPRSLMATRVTASCGHPVESSHPQSP